MQNKPTLLDHSSSSRLLAGLLAYASARFQELEAVAKKNQLDGS